MTVLRLYFRLSIPEALSSFCSEIVLPNPTDTCPGHYTEKPLNRKEINMDLPDYVTEQALDGLFTMLAAEEKKIRENPTARTTELLKTVFQ